MSDGAQPGLPSSRVTLGIYEKALPLAGTWAERFAAAARLGFDFVDLSVDESAERRARLTWSTNQQRAVREAGERNGIQIAGVCLSVHRAVGLGSADSETRSEAIRILHDGIAFCRGVGASVLQIAGYYAYYEAPDAGQAARFGAGLADAVPAAADAGVILGIENVDGNDITSISAAMALVRSVRSPWLQVYADIGNLAEQRLDTTSELAAGAGHLVALHAKDVLPGRPRKVPFGEGVADFDAGFGELARQRWSGRLMIEMWNEDEPDAAGLCARARSFIANKLTAAGVCISSRAATVPGGQAA